MATASIDITRDPGEGVRTSALVLAGVGTASIVLATAGMLRGAEPFATWYYQFAWYGTLLLMEAIVGLRTGRFLLLDRPAHLASVMAWSAIIWLFYELINFRLENWYYVFLPQSLPVRWVSTMIAFATVLPAVLLVEAMLRSFGVFERTRCPAMDVDERGLIAMRGAGAAMMAAVLLWPRYCFPLVWGATTLLVEPTVYRRKPQLSLIGDLQRGEPGRALRLLVGGAMIGILWEMFNARARSKWIYTVPFLEEVKLFEMPVAGFLGFPPFALECWVLWQALVLAGVAVPRDGRRRVMRKRVRSAIAMTMAAFSALVLIGMERRTVSSLRPELAHIAGPAAPALQAAGFDAFSLASAGTSDVANAAQVPVDVARDWIERARLATLRGIGTQHADILRAVGISSVEMLASSQAATLATRMEATTGQRIPAARVRVWVRAAQKVARPSAPGSGV